ncbi:MAG: TIGR00730 family Rossman fold protein [Microbacterium sp.]|uniref:LOG family protein n=1 Tax=Microbacterium sp. TaxID=51671 RepID=UPI00260B37F6|nr:TIGR00730 family Rossman fold protein [Microbacterium sp.]MCX6502421.1 TIGR00730 family Rossman fold protein [Microbacterium sp.]
MSTIGRVAVYTGSSPGTSPIYREAATQVGRFLGASGVGVVYGGGHVGLMGTVADAALTAGGEAIGVIPQALVNAELAHPGLTALEVVPDMHVRKMRMSDLADAFVALPGGPGTLEEFFEAWTWLQLGFHRKPVALYDVDGFWQPLLRMLDGMVEAGFLQADFRASLLVVDTPETLLTAFREWEPPTPKFAR